MNFNIFVIPIRGRRILNFLNCFFTNRVDSVCAVYANEIGKIASYVLELLTSLEKLRWWLTYLALKRCISYK